MADNFLQEEARWEEGIRQVETTDVVLGGPSGIPNIAPNQLANRTLFLKNKQSELFDKFDQEKTSNPLPQYMIYGDSSAIWASMPIGHPFALELHIPGVEPPPTDNPKFRYIKLSSDDPYNNGILINEVVTGTAPVLSVTAEINFPQSPMHGQRIELRNTSRVFSRSGAEWNGGVVFGDTIRNLTASVQLVGNNSTEGIVLEGVGAMFPGSMNSSSTGYSSVTSPNVRSTSLYLDASRVAPTSNQNQPVHIEEPFFQRIF